MTALDKQAREYINKLIDDANSESDDPECYICGGMRQLLSDGVAAFATQVREQSKWVSVKERLPNNGDVVLIAEMATVDNETFTDLRCVIPAFFCNDDGPEWFREVNRESEPTSHRRYWTVTHWQPLPAPPETTEQEER